MANVTDQIPKVGLFDQDKLKKSQEMQLLLEKRNPEGGFWNQLSAIGGILGAIRSPEERKAIEEMNALKTKAIKGQLEGMALQGAVAQAQLDKILVEKAVSEVQKKREVVGLRGDEREDTIATVGAYYKVLGGIATSIMYIPEDQPEKRQEMWDIAKQGADVKYILGDNLPEQVPSQMQLINVISKSEDFQKAAMGDKTLYSKMGIAIDPFTKGNTFNVNVNEAAPDTQLAPAMGILDQLEAAKMGEGKGGTR